MSIQKFLCDVSEATGIPVADLYCVQNGKRVDDDDARPIDGAAPLRWRARLVGGKGGFGSMLRAIGAQIEKTTNREACRDLSGRRLRDIREERRLREWAAAREQREREAAERRDEKLKRLARAAEPPQVKFEDPEYEKARSALEDDVEEAVRKGLAAKKEEEGGPKASAAVKRGKPKGGLWIDGDLSEGATTSEEEDEAPPEKRAKGAETAA